jgi:hypothetical protein
MIHYSFLACVIGLLLPVPGQAAKVDGNLTLSVVDSQSGAPLAVRMQLRDGRGRPVSVRGREVVTTGDSLVFEGHLTLELRKGKYTFDLEAGPEFHTRQGHFVVDRHAEDSKEISLTRKVNMHEEGWWAGDLDVWHPLDDMQLLMRAEHVDLVPLLRQQNVRGKCTVLKDRRRTSPSELTAPLYGPWAVLDRCRGGGLLLFGQTVAPDVCGRKADAPSLPLVSQADTAEGKVVAMTPFAWDLPIWLASGKLDAIAILHRHALRGGTVDNEAWGKVRDKTFFPGKLGNGRWSEAIYQHVLNCGLRVPPAAGSGAGTNGNPLGTNRVYVYCGNRFSQGASFSRELWWQGLQRGQVLVTNGPLLRVQVEGHPPGHVFQVDRGRTREFQIGLKLTFYLKWPVEYLEIVKDGQVEYEVRLDDLARRQGRLPVLKFDESGWFLVRAVTSETRTYQFASTGPYYVEADYGRRISRKSVRFFLDWLDEAAEKFTGNEPVQAEIAAALPFWHDLLERANAE